MRRLCRYSGLLWLLAVTELKARHRQTVLGMTWVVLQPLSMVLVLTVVFSLFVRVPLGDRPYAVVVYVALVAWLFFANAVSAASTSIVGNMNLVTKANFPREVLPLARILTVGFDFIVGMMGVVVVTLLHGVPVRATWLLLPMIAAVQAAFTIGVALLVSALYVLKRDMGNLLPLVLQLGMFLSPVLYSVTLVPVEYQQWYLLNPLATMIETYRDALLAGTIPPAGLLGACVLTSLVVLALGYRGFKAIEPRFADIL